MTTISTRTRVTALGALVALALTACGSGGEEPTKPRPDQEATSRQGTTEPDAVSVKPGDVTIPAKVPNRPGKRGAVETTECGPSAGGWQAAGTATARDKAQEFVITVFFTTEHATVVQWGRTQVSVAAGQSARWQVDVDLDVRGELRCVLRGVA
ncbi:hypothetical protein [Nocardioides nitrophenolicus]|uniref:hypothetical protein n=1 Tax=Nocardioides nitrophenolicus TaxID=60489 RepID=UPI00195E2062|nr:hypothetical protein [Nocardioides nitrophenolicus]MBM7519111.1 hypothetical protein [Nocardioides nitrophenolicus]